MKKLIAASMLLLMLVLAACSIPVRPNPTAVPTLTLIAVSTLAPTNTSWQLTGTPDTEGRAASEWNGIPIMPGAIAGEGDEESYVFTVRATPQQVQEYYQLELGKLGWQPIDTGDGDSSSMLMFTNKDSATLTVSIMAKGEDVLVLLVK